jgi:hypothetical protein
MEEEEIEQVEKQDFKYKPTTAFWKICKLLDKKEPLYIIQGGQ